MKGKILLGLTAILMLTGASVPVKADDVWKFDAQRFVLKEYTGTETDVVVPDTMDEGKDWELNYWLAQRRLLL